MAPEAPRAARAFGALRAPRGRRGPASPWPWRTLTLLAVLVAAATRTAADAEVYQEYARSARDEAAAPAAVPKWPEPESQSEDEVVDRISMLMGPSKEVGGDLDAQRQRLFRLRDEQQQRQEQQDRQQEDSLQKQLQEERLNQQAKQQQQRPAGQQDSRTPQRPPDDGRQMQRYWQEAARAALAKQQQEAGVQAQQGAKLQQEAGVQAQPGAKLQQEAGVQAQQGAKLQQAAVQARQQEQAAKQEALARQQEAQARQQQEKAAKQEEAKARQQEALARQQEAQARQQQEKAAQQEEAAAAKALEQAAKDEARDELQQEDLDTMYDIERALTQQPSVPAIDQTLLKAYMQSGAWPGQRYWDQLLARPQQPAASAAVSDLIAELLNDAARRTQHAVQWRAQQQQQTQDRQQQMLLQAQHDQMDPGTARKMQVAPQLAQPQQQPQPPFTFSFQRPEQTSRFGVNPADPRFWQEDPRLQYLSRAGAGADGSQPQEEQYDEGSSGVRQAVRQALMRSASGLGLPTDTGLSSEQQPDLPDDLDVDEEVLGAAAGDAYPSETALWLRRQQQQQQQLPRVTPPVAPKVGGGSGGGARHQPKPTATRDSRLDEDATRSAGLSSHDYPVVKKQLTFPKDHWFFGMDDVGKLATFIGASIAVSSLILGFIVWQYRLHRNAKAAADVEYPAYGVTGPNKDVSPTGDRRLAQSAQMYHYQHQKQQILAMESRAAGARRGSMSEAESEDENEEGDYTVYECPGLAPTQEMEVKNPLFQDDPTPATPAPGVGAEAGHDGDGLPEGGKQQQQQASKSKDRNSTNGKTTRSNSRPNDKSDRP